MNRKILFSKTTVIWHVFVYCFSFNHIPTHF